MPLRRLWLDLVLMAILVAAALPTRLAVTDAYSADTAGQGADALQSEERLYNRYAVPWAKGEGAWPREKEFPWHPLGSFTHRPPAYALFLGLVYRAAGSENFAAVRRTQAWLDTLTVLLVYLAGVLAFGRPRRRTAADDRDADGKARAEAGPSKDLGSYHPRFGRLVGFTAALAIARYDFLEQLTTRLLSETLFTFLSMAFVVAALVAVRPELSPTRRALAVLLAGYLLGWANLTRPFLLPAALVFPLWIALAPALGRPDRLSEARESDESGNDLGPSNRGRNGAARRLQAHPRLAAALAATLGLALAILPVTWRNWQFHHALVLISSNSGFTVFNSVLGTPGLSHPEALGTEEDVDALELGELAEQGEFRRRALAYLKAYPEDWGRIFGEKVKTLLASAEGHKISHVLLPTPNDAWLYPLVLIGALLSLLVFPRWAWHPRLLLLLVAASQYGTSMLTKAELRYRVPIVPILALAAAWAVFALGSRLLSFTRRAT